MDNLQKFYVDITLFLIIQLSILIYEHNILFVQFINRQINNKLNNQRMIFNTRNLIIDIISNKYLKLQLIIQYYYVRIMTMCDEPLLSKLSDNPAQLFYPMEIRYEKLNVIAEIKKKKNVILHNQSGLMKPGTFTAILGPSGSGKTTLLNFLSGRLTTDNLFTYGEFYLNGNRIKSVEPYANQIGYIMQDDTLMETMTPRQSFMFCADMRLKLKQQDKIARVQKLIQQLGLSDCCDTKIGNNLIKGISGGERKRTSIGIDLITNPSIVFLDEPTTGLDSTTALQVILLLRKLANEGRTIISTIHQPSSQVFSEFDKLLLLVDGRCIYQGDSKLSESYFANLGYQCPQLVNIAQYYMDLMSFQYGQKSPDGEIQGQKQQYQLAKDDHQNNIIKFQQAYKQSNIHKELMIQACNKIDLVQNNRDFNVNGWKQFGLIYQRATINQVRNPLDVALKLFQAVFTAMIVLLVFGRINTTYKDPNADGALLQNIRGIIFFLVSFNTFAGLQGTLATFSGQKPIFLRQRFSNTYSTNSYFWGRSFANLPFELIYPTVPSAIIFWAVGLNHNDPWNFPKTLIIVNSVYFCAASYGLFYSAVIPKLQIAMALVPVLIIPFMMLSGFFISLQQVPRVFYPLEFLSPFRYGFQANMINEFHNKKSFEQFTPNTLWENVVILIGLGFGLRTISFIAMYLISNPRRPNIKQPLEAQELVIIISKPIDNNQKN